MERRRNARVQLNLQCRITSSRSGANPWVGVTENMSRGDLLVTLHKEQLGNGAPAVGDPWLVEIDLPANHSFGRKCMQCQTTVARLSENANGTLHVALRIHKIRFQSSGDGLGFPPNPAAEQVVM